LYHSNSLPVRVLGSDRRRLYLQSKRIMPSLDYEFEDQKVFLERILVYAKHRHNTCQVVHLIVGSCETRAHDEIHILIYEYAYVIFSCFPLSCRIKNDGETKKTYTGFRRSMSQNNLAGKLQIFHCASVPTI